MADPRIPVPTNKRERTEGVNTAVRVLAVSRDVPVHIYTLVKSSALVTEEEEERYSKCIVRQITTSSGKGSVSISKIYASPKWDETRCPEE